MTYPAVGLFLGPVFTEIPDNKKLPFSFIKDGQTLTGEVPVSGKPMLSAFALGVSSAYPFLNRGRLSLLADVDLGFALGGQHSTLLWTAAARSQFNFSNDVYAFARLGYGGFGAFPEESESIFRNGALLAIGLGGKLMGPIDGNCSLGSVITGSETQWRTFCGVSMPIGSPDKKTTVEKPQKTPPSHLAKLALNNAEAKLIELENLNVWEWMKRVAKIDETSSIDMHIQAANAFVSWITQGEPAGNEPKFVDRTAPINKSLDDAQPNTKGDPELTERHNKLTTRGKEVRSLLIHNVLKLIFASKGSAFERTLKLGTEIKTDLENEDLMKSPEARISARTKIDRYKTLFGNLTSLLTRCDFHLIRDGAVDSLMFGNKITCYEYNAKCPEGLDEMLTWAMMNKKMTEIEAKYTAAPQPAAPVKKTNKKK